MREARRFSSWLQVRYAILLGFLILIVFPQLAFGDCADYGAPTPPSIVGRYLLPYGDRAFGVGVSGNYAYVTSDGGLRVIDISNPASPHAVGSLGYPYFVNGHSIVVAEPYLYAAAWDHLVVIDISNKTAPHVVGDLTIPPAATCLAISGSHAYVGGGAFLGLQVIDITVPASPAMVGSVPIMQFTNGVAISGHYAFVAGYEQGTNYQLSGLKVVDVADPTSPVIVGNVDSPGLAQDVVLNGNYAYLADSYAGFHVVDITNPTSPAIVGSVDTPGRVHQIALGGSFVYVTDRTYGLQAIDATNPTSPFIVGGKSGLFYSYGIAVTSSYVYLLEGGADAPQSDLSILPTQCASGACTDPLSLTALEVNPNTINTQAGGNYITAHLEFPQGYDPAQVLLQTVRLNGTVAAVPGFFDIQDWNHNHIPDLAVKFARNDVEAALQEGDQVPVSITGTIGDRCFSGTTLVRVVRPHLNHPNGGESYLAGDHMTVEWDNPQGWAVSYAQIYYSKDGGNSWSLIADQVAGTSYEWTVPVDPTGAGVLRVMLVDDAGVMGYDSSDGPFTVSSATTGLPDTTPIRQRLYQNSPNPFRGATRVTFDLPEEVKVTLKVFDLNGRVVRVLADGWYPAGTHEMPWNALDAGGKPVSAGVYFLHIAAGSFTDTKRMYLQK